LSFKHSYCAVNFISWIFRWICIKYFTL
jgi:hypothetical protein